MKIHEAFSPWGLQVCGKMWQAMLLENHPTIWLLVPVNTDLPTPSITTVISE